MAIKKSKTPTTRKKSVRKKPTAKKKRKASSPGIYVQEGGFTNLPIGYSGTVSSKDWLNPPDMEAGKRRTQKKKKKRKKK